MKKLQFSKLILLLETAMVVWISQRTLGFVRMAIELDYCGSLTCLTTLVSAVWAAYGTSVSFYYNKSKAENVTRISASAPDDRDI